MSAHRRLHDPAYLRLHILGNSHVQDVSGHGLNGAWNAAEAYGDGPYGHMMMDHTGATAYVDASGLSLTGEWTLALLVQSDDISSAAAFYPLGTGSTTGVFYGGSATPANLGYYDGTTTMTVATAAVGKWTHIVVAKTGTTYTIYSDGEYGNSGTLVDVNITAVRIGKRSDNNWPFNGRLGDVRAYNVCLTGDEAAALFRYDRRV